AVVVAAPIPSRARRLHDRVDRSVLRQRRTDRGAPRVASRVEPHAMSRATFRVFVTKHHGGLVSAVLLRRFRVLFDAPPPAAMARDVETALARLAPQAALLAEEADQVARYLWSEQLELRRLEV